MTFAVEHSEQFQMTTLPQELLTKVFLYLEPQDLINIALCNRHLTPPAIYVLSKHPSLSIKNHSLTQLALALFEKMAYGDVLMCASKLTDGLEKDFIHFKVCSVFAKAFQPETAWICRKIKSHYMRTCAFYNLFEVLVKSENLDEALQAALEIPSQSGREYALLRISEIHTSANNHEKAAIVSDLISFKSLKRFKRT